MPTTPPTFAGSEILAADDLNLLRDAILELQLRADGADYQAAQVFKNSQSIPNSTDTEVIFQAQVFDLGAWWASGTDIIVPAAAIPSGSTTIGVRVIFRCKFAANTTGSRQIQALLNGVSFGSKTVRAESVGVTDSELIEVAPTCEAGDVITMVVTQTSGGALTATYSQATVERAGVTG